MDSDHAYSESAAAQAEDDRVYSRIVTGFAIGIAILLAVVFVSVLA